MRILFNCLVHTNNGVVEDLINGINKYTKDPIICLHVNQCFGDFDPRFFDYKNVYINPTKYLIEDKFDSKVELLLSNHNYISKVLELKYDFEIFFYMKMGFVRPDIEEYLKGADATVWPPPLHEYHPPRPIPNNKFFNEILKKVNGKSENVISTTIEGLGCSYSVSNRVFEDIEDSPNKLFYKDVDQGVARCAEEYVIPTFINKHSKHAKIPAVYMSRGLGADELESIYSGKEKRNNSYHLNNSHYLNILNVPGKTGPGHLIKDVYMAHRIEYENNNSVREYYRKKFLND